jgi:high-affinity iron transporter
VTDLIITFRETLEASLIVGIILAYLSQTKRKAYNYIIYLAVGVALVCSVVLAVIFNIFLGGFSGVAEELFEGIAMIIASIMVSTIILWMMRQRDLVKKINGQIDRHISLGQKWGLFILVFLSVLREGVETVILLSASSLNNGGNNLVLALLGIFLAVLLGILIFKAGIKMSLRPFFLVTSVFLIVFGAGLFAHGVHELQEAKIIPTIVEHVWNTNYLLDENGFLGKFAKHLFGYNGNPSLIEVFSYIMYLNTIYILSVFLKKSTNKNIKEKNAKR